MPAARPGSLGRRLAWFTALWLAGVLSVAAVGAVIRVWLL
jgi:hypothetical protein